MSFLHVNWVWRPCCWLVSVISMNWLSNGGVMDTKADLLSDGAKIWLKWGKVSGNSSKIHYYYYQYIIGSKGVRKTWWRKLMITWFVFGIIVSFSVFWYLSSQVVEKRKETLVSMCMNHVQAMSILISTFHHGKNASAIDQRTSARYTERTASERPLTSGVAYAVRVLPSEREQFERQQDWMIKRMDTLEQTPVHEDEYGQALEPSPINEEYAPVIFAQDTIAHVVSIDMLSGKSILSDLHTTRTIVKLCRARASGKGALTAPFKLLKSNRLGVILTFAVYKKDLPSNATPKERIEATDGYLGGVFDIESLVEKLLQQLSCEQSILVNVHDTTNSSEAISMYGSDALDNGLEHVGTLNFGDPFRKHEMRCT